MPVAQSKNGVPIRLSDERWAHITEEHSELAGLRLEVLETVSYPERIFEGRYGEILAIRGIEPRKWIVVVYRELQDNGFVITAFVTTRVQSLTKRKQIWP